MQVSEIMSRPVIVVNENDSLETVARTILKNNIGGVPVVDSAGGITGIITESDFGAKEKSVPFSTFRSAKVLDQWLSGNQIERIYDTARNRPAKEIMSRRVKVLSEDDPVEKAAELSISTKRGPSSHWRGLLNGKRAKCRIHFQRVFKGEFK